ncbi:MAG: penicillin-binding protein 2 [Solirubrobacteraceae bacterium]
MISSSGDSGKGPRFGVPEEERPPLSPQLALRVAIVGSCALAMFAIIFFRLWFLQVLSGNQYLAQAKTNRVRDIAIAAPRGEIVDRNGTVLVDSNRALAVQISPPDLPVPVTVSNIADPPRRDAVVYNRLAHVLGMSTTRARCRIPGPPYKARLSRVACVVAKQVSLLPYADATIKSGTVVSRYVQYYLAERQNDFPGVQVQRVYVTHYPHTTLAAQVLGTVGPINSAEIKAQANRGVSPNAVIGQSGLEAQYDGFLRGKDGHEEVQVNSLGQPTGDLATQAPVAGHDLKLSLDANLQRAGQTSLQESMSDNASPGGAFVAMNPQNGQVYAMGSMPSYDPSIFTGNLSESTYKKLTSPSSGDPLLNRAIQSAGPTGSTFKPITSVAALQSGEWSLSDTFDDTGQYCVGTGASEQCRHNAGGAVDGVLNLVDAIKVSSDDFFYHLGALTNTSTPDAHPNGGPLDQWAHAFGIGRSTGVDLPDAANGTLPSPKWRDGRNRLEAECDDATGPFKGKPKHPPGGCGIADGTNRSWSVGDNESLAVGQGDVQVTPLQLAVAYSALANGGTIYRPHLGLDVQDNEGTVLQNIDPPPSRHIAINPLYLQSIQQGLRDAASQPGGTSADVFHNFPEQVYGKTGTAQYISPTTGEQDYAWYACFVPATATSKPIVVVVWVEKGGFGAVGAAPVARQILSQWFFGKPGPYQAGSSTTL